MRASEFLPESISTGQGGGSVGKGGGQMVGGPTTYEQEYNMFKRKGARRITAMTNEALDSSYPYTQGEKYGDFYFTTDNGLEYIVRLGNKRHTSVQFAQKGEGDSAKTGLTGTGDSRKIFGTVIQIVKDFVEKYNPPTISFNGYNGEPSRIKLYKTLALRAEQELPNYIFIGAVPKGPTTEFTLKRKEQKEVNEALDSSYPYEFKNNAYYFTTDAGEEYKVVLKGDKKVEVSFMARGENDQPKDDITGTGDSRKVFGTVINIVKDYVGQNQPDILLFAADNSEPSRVRLYNMLASQASKALPGYEFAKAMKGGMFTTFYLTRDGINVPKLDTAKNLAGRALDKIAED